MPANATTKGSRVLFGDVGRTNLTGTVSSKKRDVVSYDRLDGFEL
jgi:hypothetical protein